MLNKHLLTKVLLS